MKAAEGFRTRLEDVELLMDTLVPPWRHDSSAPMPPRNQIAVACRSAIVLMVSYFEGYLKELIDEACDEICDREISGLRLPDALRGHIVEQYVAVLRAGGEASNVWRASEELTRVTLALRRDRPVSEELVPREALKRLVTSIDPKNLNAMLKAFGASRNDLTKGTISAHGEKLRALKRVRDNAVHSNESDLPNLGTEDVREYLHLLAEVAMGLGQQLDDVLARF